VNHAVEELSLAPVGAGGDAAPDDRPHGVWSEEVEDAAAASGPVLERLANDLLVFCLVHVALPPTPTVRR
jgi:hypothetical protein